MELWDAFKGKGKILETEWKVMVAAGKDVLKDKANRYSHKRQMLYFVGPSSGRPDNAVPDGKLKARDGMIKGTPAAPTLFPKIGFL